MFIINLTYKAPLDQIDQHLEAHIAYLDRQYAAGHFCASGRKVPRNGGIILSQLTDKAQLLANLLQDPFQQYDLADYNIIEFVPTKTSKELEILLQ